MKSFLPPNSKPAEIQTQELVGSKATVFTGGKVELKKGWLNPTKLNIIIFSSKLKLPAIGRNAKCVILCGEK